MPKKIIPDAAVSANQSDLLSQPVPSSFEAATAELDQLVCQMESSQLPLDQLLTSYQRGAFLLQFCQGKLQALEQQVSIIDNGQMKPWINAA